MSAKQQRDLHAIKRIYYDDPEKKRQTVEKIYDKKESINQYKKEQIRGKMNITFYISKTKVLRKPWSATGIKNETLKIQTLKYQKARCQEHPEITNRVPKKRCQEDPVPQRENQQMRYQDNSEIHKKYKRYLKEVNVIKKIINKTKLRIFLKK